MNLVFPAQNLVFFDGVFGTAERYICASEMFAGFPGYLYLIELCKSVVQLRPAGFVSTLNKTPAVRNFTLLRRNPLHIWSDG